MKTRAERLGFGIGRVVRALARREARLSQFLVSKGLPPIVLWIVKLAVLAAILSVSVALAVLIAGLLLLAKWVSHGDTSGANADLQWRVGPLGFGLYDRSGHRVDP